MKLSEVLEKKTYTVKHTRGRHSHEHEYTEAGLKRIPFFKHGDLARIMKLKPDAVLKLTSEDEAGKLTIIVTRNS